MKFFQLLGFASAALSAPVLEESAKSKSFLKQIDDSTWVLGNPIWNVTQNRQYANKLFYKGKDRVGKAVGHYVSYNGAASDLNWTSAAIVASGSDYINVKFTAKEGDFHWVIYDDLAGAYQYFVNHALPVLGEFRTLWRLDNASFTNGRTYLKDGPLPPLSEYLSVTKVQDETWQKADGSFLTKYDWSAVIRSTDFYGVYGEEVGSWYMNPGKDYYNGDQTKGELMIHRESLTGDTVQLNMIHGTHFQAVATDTFADGKTWGPWLWYLNDGSKTDAAARATQEDAKWPYKWYEPLDKAYRTRGRMQGQLTLSDGRPAAGANIFLGDSNSNKSTLDQGANYYYTTNADSAGKFVIKDIREGTYGLYAWSNGGKIGDVTTTFIKNDILIREGDNTNVKELSWPITSLQNRIFQIGDFDRKTTGFPGSGGYFHGRIGTCPANITYTIGTSTPSDWCFGQSSFGQYSIIFSLDSIPATVTGAKLTVSLAGFSSGSAADVLMNGAKVGRITNTATILSSQDTYRGATVSGEWHLLELPVTKAQLRVGENAVVFNVTASTVWRGWFWDSVVLEWV